MFASEGRPVVEEKTAALRLVKSGAPLAADGVIVVSFGAFGTDRRGFTHVMAWRDSPLYSTNMLDGTVHRVAAGSNQSPAARAAAPRSQCPAPLAMQFSGAGSTTPTAMRWT